MSINMRTNVVKASKSMYSDIRMICFTNKKVEE
jgi:hypothetical protein